MLHVCMHTHTYTFANAAELHPKSGTMGEVTRKQFSEELLVLVG